RQDMVDESVCYITDNNCNGGKCLRSKACHADPWEL
uniref:U1-segestritoxin-Sf1a n=1 Tax=Segestria florentina TaxID=31925 RepID=SIT_SEGFL|nr:RecName: Full=U1-segestritoxin-Sf1a; Short=U1-SGTX-Sf1a; AltName: Full=Insectotoxin SIT [Segestria florentina]prf//1312258A insectotoxin [Segestria florentina]